MYNQLNFSTKNEKVCALSVTIFNIKLQWYKINALHMKGIL